LPADSPSSSIREEPSSGNLTIPGQPTEAQQRGRKAYLDVESSKRSKGGTNRAELGLRDCGAQRGNGGARGVKRRTSGRKYRSDQSIQ
jgi:hypothetical protein